MSEHRASKKLHAMGIPLLVSEQWLRERGCGQLDIGRLYQEKLQLYEVKSSFRLSKKQYLRLQKTSALLSELLDKESELSLYVWRKEDCFDWIPLL
ncbi:MAG: hypothetical protein EP326_09025 [Deltaproteobacteria bacterium]|nr:MAG: hypothetical protein EP326_09025 [Deltaproteobacteria bacterium]